MPDEALSEMRASMPSFAELFRRLLDTKRKPNGEHYSDQEIATWCAAHSGRTFSRTYVWMLRTGRQDQPNFEHVKALAAFFSVPIEYFGTGDYARTLQHEVELVQALRSNNAKQIALRGAGLSDEATKRVLAEIDRIQEEEEQAEADDQ
jgi:hypothetical protein